MKDNLYDLIQRAAHLVDIERYREAIRLLMKARAIEPENSYVVSLLAQSFLGLGDNIQGLKHAEEATALDPDSEWGPATHDQRHRFVLSGLYQLPWGFNFSTIMTAASGRPYTPLIGADANGDGDGGAFPSDRARRTVGDPSSSVGRNSETMSSQFIVDARVSKRFVFANGFAIEGIVDAFNLLDRANFTEINNIFGSGAFPSNPLPAYGQYTVTLPGRQIQLGAKVSF